MLLLRASGVLLKEHYNTNINLMCYVQAIFKKWKCCNLPILPNPAKLPDGLIILVMSQAMQILSCYIV